MKSTTFYILVLLLSHQIIIGQNKIIKGLVLMEDLYPIPNVKIQCADTLFIAETDFEGKFTITVPKETEKLTLTCFGIEPTFIQLLNDCDNIEIIVLNQATYDFMSNRKVDRLRLKQFKKLPKLYQNAFEKRIFVNEKPCYRQNFVKIKPELDRIRKSGIKTSS